MCTCVSLSEPICMSLSVGESVLFVGAVLNSVTSTPQCIRQPRPCDFTHLSLCLSLSLCLYLSVSLSLSLSVCTELLALKDKFFQCTYEMEHFAECQRREILRLRALISQQEVPKPQRTPNLSLTNPK